MARSFTDKEFCVLVSMACFAAGVLSTVLLFKFRHLPRLEGKLEVLVAEVAEMGFFYGQREAFDGEYSIEWNEESGKWIWSDSPWDDGSKPVLDLSKYGKNKKDD